MRKLLIITLACISIFLMFCICKTNYLYISNKEKIFTLSEENELFSERDSNFTLIGEHYSYEKLVGWLDNGILFRMEDKEGVRQYDLCKYNPSTGKKEAISLHKESDNINTIISEDKKKVIINHIYHLPTKSITAFIEEKQAANDYRYCVVGGKSNSFFEIYDPVTKKLEKILEYTIKARIDKEFSNSLSYNYSFTKMAISNDSSYFTYFLMEDNNIYSFTKYDICSETSKKYETSFGKSAEGIYIFVEQFNISNDGNTIWVKKKMEGPNVPNLRQSDLCMLDLNEKEIYSQSIASNVNTYQISFNNDYALYETYTDRVTNKNKLICLDLSSKEAFEIDENIISNGFDLSSSGTTLAYLKQKDKGAELLLKDFSDKKSESKLIYTFPELIEAECIDLSSDGKSIFISYMTNEEAKKLNEYKMCTIKL